MSLKNALKRTFAAGALGMALTAEIAMAQDVPVPQTGLVATDARQQREDEIRAKLEWVPKAIVLATTAGIGVAVALNWPRKAKEPKP